MDNRAIGVFDSGLGGLTVLNELAKLLPCENIVYFGDTGRIPYGTRSRETIIKYAEQDMDFLIRHNVKCIIAACGTVSTVLLPEVYGKYNVLYTGVVEHAVRAAVSVNNKEHLHIGVIATSAAIKSGTYERIVHEHNSEAKVFVKACPLFVPLVENGYTARDNEIAILTAREYLQPLCEKEIDALIMGCTHFPILKDIIQDIMGENVTLIDPGFETARYMANKLKELNMLSGNKEKGKYNFFLSDSTELFIENAKIFLGEKITGKYEQITTEN